VQDRLDRNKFRLVSMWTFSRFYSRLTDTRYNVIFHLKVIFKRDRRARACNSDRRIGAVRRDAAIAERRERAAGRSLVARSIPDDLRKRVSNRWIIDPPGRQPPEIIRLKSASISERILCRSLLALRSLRASYYVP